MLATYPENSGGLSNLSIYLSIHLSINSYLYLNLYIYIHIFIHVSDLVNLSIYLTIYLWSTYLAFARTHMYNILSLYIYITVTYINSIYIITDIIHNTIRMSTFVLWGKKSPNNTAERKGPRQRDSCRWCPSPAGAGRRDVFRPRRTGDLGGAVPQCHTQEIWGFYAGI